MSAPGKAVAKKSEAQVLLKDYGPSLASVMPAHVKPEAFMEFAAAQAHADKYVMQGVKDSPRTFVLALRECAYLGHVPRKGTYDLVAFKNHTSGKYEVTGIEEYTGALDRMYRAGAVTSVKVEVVRESDHFAWSPTRMRLPEHEFEPLADEAERGALKGVYAYAVMIDGATISQVVVMGRSEVMKHKAIAKTKKFWEGSWEADMWRKTALHKLEKFVPMSAEYRISQAGSAAAAIAQFPDAPPVDTPLEFADSGEVHDADIVDENEPSPTNPPEPQP